MHDDELHRQIAELVADHAEHADAPPVAAIRRRGRLRRGRQASGVVLLIAAVAVGLVAVQRPLGRQVTPVPVVTQPSPPVVTELVLPPPRPPSASFAAYVRGRFRDELVDLSVLALPGRRAAGYEWQLAALRGFSETTAHHMECLVYKTKDSSDHFGYKCMAQSATNKMTFDRGMDGRPLWGLVPKEATRVRLLRAGAPPIEVPTRELAPPFRRRIYFLGWASDIQAALALDRQGHQIAHLAVP